MRARRDALAPNGTKADEGLRRHVPGLRREEVAKRAGISATWYTWIEQGREINMSPVVLESIGRALNLRPTEVAYIKLLAADTPAERYEPDPVVPDALRELVESHGTSPAYIATPRLDLLVWNDILAALLEYDRNGPELSRNILWRLFFDSKRREQYVDWYSVARGAVAAFRSTYTRYRGDPHFDALVRVMLENEDFAELWKRWEVGELGLPPFYIRTQDQGVVELSTIQATLDIAPGCYLCLFHLTRLDV